MFNNFIVMLNINTSDVNLFVCFFTLYFEIIVCLQDAFFLPFLAAISSDEQCRHIQF